MQVLDYARSDDGSPRPVARFVAWVVIASALDGCCALWLFLLRGPRILDRDGVLIGGWMALGLLVVALAVLLKTTPADALRLRPRVSAAIILGGAAALQGGAFIMEAPALSDELVWYAEDGAWVGQGLSPYSTPVRMRLVLGPGSCAGVWHVISRSRATNYGPVSEIVLAALMRLDPHFDQSLTQYLDERAAVDINGGIASYYPLRWEREAAVNLHAGAAFRLAFALCAIVSTALLLLILRRAGESPWWAVLFAWNPLVVIETGGMGHQDALAVLLLLWVLLEASRRRFRTAGVALALACGVEPLAVLLLPFLWRQTHGGSDDRAGYRRGRQAVLCFLVTAAVVFLPALLYQRGYAGWFEAIGRACRADDANGPLLDFARWMFNGSTGSALAFTALLVLAVAGAAWQLRATLAEAGYWLSLTLYLAGPAAHPWRLIFALGFIPLLRGPQGWAGLLLAAGAGVAYRMFYVGVPLGPFDTFAPRWDWWRYGPAFVVLGLEIVCLTRRPVLARLS